MNSLPQKRLLTIGEFAAATQLTAKALRLYDDQALLRPTTTDSVTGYRYYGSDQVATGRFIRALRDMNLSLERVAQVLESDAALRQILLRSFLADAEERLSRERRAYQSALLMMHSRSTARAIGIDEITAGEQTVSVWNSSSNRRSLLQHLLQQRSQIAERLQARGIETGSTILCALVEPLAEEDGPIELLVPLGAMPEGPVGITTRHLPAQSYASIRAEPTVLMNDIPAYTDALFDWFDRHSKHAQGQPEIVLAPDGGGLSVSLRWAFSSRQSLVRTP